METILDYLLCTAPQETVLSSVDAWWRRHGEVASGFDAPVDRAIAAGFACDRLGYAFASGYNEALRALVPTLPAVKTALCATETGGNRPRHIETTLERDGDVSRLTGTKTFTTLGKYADQLVVIAKEGVDEAGRNRLVAVVVPSNRDGITMTVGPETPFVPEISHAVTHFEAVAVADDERLPGDGFDGYLKPFRTIEDCHVHAAFLGWLFGVARRSAWPQAELEQLLALVVSVRSIALGDPLSPPTHLAFAGLAAQLGMFLEAAEPLWQSVEPETTRRWRRDRALLAVAGKAREARRVSAWARASPGLASKK